MGVGKKQTLGYKYKGSILFAVCKELDEIQEFQAGEKSVWAGEGYDYVVVGNSTLIQQGADIGNITSNTSILVHKPNLFGGDKKEGGISGFIDIMFGGPSQTKNSYLQSLLGSVIPAYRGFVTILLRQCYLTSLTPYVKPWRVKGKFIPQKSWYSAKSDISGGANAAHIIRDVLLDDDVALGFTDSVIDDASFMSVADTVYDEGIGISIGIYDQITAFNFISNMLNHINGLIYLDKTTGKFKLKLIRDDYTPASLPVFDESNIKKLNYFERSSFGELINEITIVYRPQGTTKNDSITFHNLQSIEDQGSIIPQTFNMIGLDNATSAAKVAQYVLASKSNPLARLEIVVNRKIAALEIGDVFKFSWSEYNISEMIFRVFSIKYGDIKDGTIVITASQDVFSFPNSTYLVGQDNEFTDPIQNPQVISNKNFKEAPYWEVHNQLATGDFENLDETSCFLITFAGYQNFATINFEFWTKVGSNDYGIADTVSFSSYLITGANYSYMDGLTGNEIPLDSPSTLVGDVIDVDIGSYAYWDNEIIRIDKIDLVNNLLTIARGCLDTLPQLHNSGSRIYFVEDYLGFDEEEYVTSTDVDAKLLPRTSNAILDIGSDTAVQTTMVGRFGMPYCPGKIQINSFYFPDLDVNSYPEAKDDLTITWAHRDRTLQIATVTDFTEGDIGPEAGVTYDLEIFDEDDTSLVSETGLSTNTYSYSLSDEYSDSTTPKLSSQLRITLKAVRSAIDSYQTYDYTFQRAITPLWLSLFTTNMTLSNGNLTAQKDSSAVASVTYSAVRVLNNESAYCEITIDALNGNNIAIGTGSDETLTSAQNVLQGGSITSTDGTPSGSGVTFSDSDVIGIAYKNGSIWFSQNGTFINSGDPVAGTGAQITGISGDQFIQFFGAADANQPQVTANFGDDLSGNPFTYSVPSGFNSGWKSHN